MKLGDTQVGVGLASNDEIGISLEIDVGRSVSERHHEVNPELLVGWELGGKKGGKRGSLDLIAVGGKADGH